MSLFRLSSILVVALFASRATAQEPRLVLLIAVDQLRGDVLTRYQHRFVENGFRRLLDSGVHFANAHYPQAMTGTGPGHATLVTGTYPSTHGIVANDWIDPETGAPVYCCQDPRYQWIGVNVPRTKVRLGTSPRNLRCPTIGDELVIATAGRARVFAVSLKDRSAILSAGARGKAFWYASDTGAFVSSTYYYPTLPDCAAAFNAAKPADRYQSIRWELLHDRATYRAHEDDRPYEKPAYAHLGRTFPHPHASERAKDFYSALRLTPAGDELTLEFTLALLEAEKLGQGDTTDFLCVGFSSTDYIGHAFGPASLEAEDNLLRLDRTLARLFDAIDTRLGLDRVVIALSSDHGVAEAPEHLASLGLDTRRFALDPLLQSLDQRLRDRFGPDVRLVRGFLTPSVNLDSAAIQAHGLERAEVERAAASILRESPAVYTAIAHADLLARRVPENALGDRLLRSFDPSRSGHVYLVPRPYWLVDNASACEAIAATHGSPWSYDTHVPLIIRTAHTRALRVDREVGPEDLAPTLAALLRIRSPVASDGEPLPEVTRARAMK